MAEIRERIKGTSRVIAEIRGPKEDVARAVRQVNGVKEVNLSPNEGWNHLRIETSEGRDVREEIASVAARHNWGLRDLRLETGGLEDFFIQITAEAAGSKG